MKCYRLIIPILMLLLFAIPAFAEVTTVIPFDAVPAGVVCGQVWQENQVDVSFVLTTAEDCDQGAGNCSFGAGPGAGFVWLYPSRLLVDFGQSYNVTRVEIDWYDACGIGCTRGFLYNAGSTVASAQNAVVSSDETVTLIPVGGMCDSIAVSSCEGQINEIRITADTVPDQGQTWGALKAMYR